ncbi:cation diffusion facilitator transporter [Nocardioides szechwanensis]|uniref:Cation diffusion facilitator family transporter n=1 Tax=Nocardioides szechwanensis TaxID=1005944 RepID=A0A1G9ZKH1_9ACTN|nr:cation diffusion facilitator family transporter [Nocardioides szechwanensis]GEP33973.1 cation diffusion facilitator transporter [Nocardioides szechwanensis]SDN21992.1 cation diffusion facilitator family transporter [Nocardioides szechwanensis]
MSDPTHDHGDDHKHEDDHGHDHEHSTGLRGVLTDLFRPHSHDAADSIDSALEASADGIRAVKISLVALLVTALAQAVVVVVTGSVALLADTIHNFSDALTAVPLWIAFVLGRRRPTTTYTYGYGRAEDLAGIFIVFMIAASAVLAGYESIRRLIDPSTLTYPWVVIAAGLIGFAGNELVAAYRIRIGRRIGSAALVADGLHARTDGFTSLAVVFGAIGVMLGFPLADPIVGLLITVAILFVLRGAARDIYRRLMDAVDPALTEQATTTVRDTDGVLDVEYLRLRWIGHRISAEAGVIVAADLDLRAAHDIAHDAQHRLLHEVPRLTAATIHVSPQAGLDLDPHHSIGHHNTLH